MEAFLQAYPSVEGEHARAAWSVPMEELYAIICGGPGDRYGVTNQQFQAAQASHRGSPLIRLGMYVPTREEVLTLEAGELGEFLDGWMWESPTELIPTNTQIAAVRFDLQHRADAESEVIRELIEWCDDFLRS